MLEQNNWDVYVNKRKFILNNCDFVWNTEKKKEQNMEITENEYFKWDHQEQVLKYVPTYFYRSFGLKLISLCQFWGRRNRICSVCLK